MKDTITFSALTNVKRDLLMSKETYLLFFEIYHMKGTIHFQHSLLKTSARLDM
jgi:hypothetical protein